MRDIRNSVFFLHHPPTARQPHYHFKMWDEHEKQNKIARQSSIPSQAMGGAGATPLKAERTEGVLQVNGFQDNR